MTIARLAPLFLVLAACAVDSPGPAPAPHAPIQHGDELRLTWSPGQERDCERCTPRAVVSCGHKISDPCPYLLFTTTLGVEGEQYVFGNATGGSDQNGNPAENLLPVYLPFVTGAGGEILLDTGGDDGGLRHAATLEQTATGYAGDINYTLFIVPGWTTFHVEMAWERP